MSEEEVARFLLDHLPRESGPPLLWASSNYDVASSVAVLLLSAIAVLCVTLAVAMWDGLTGEP